jgi:hypothetical protein
VIEPGVRQAVENRNKIGPDRLFADDSVHLETIARQGIASQRASVSFGMYVSWRAIDTYGSKSKHPCSR